MSWTNSSLSDLTITGGLEFKHFRVALSAADDLAVASIFGNFAVYKNQDSIRHAHGGKTMRDRQRHLALREVSKSLENLAFGSGIEGGGGFVEDQQL